MMQPHLLLEPNMGMNPMMAGHPGLSGMMMPPPNFGYPYMGLPFANSPLLLAGNINDLNSQQQEAVLMQIAQYKKMLNDVLQQDQFQTSHTQTTISYYDEEVTEQPGNSIPFDGGEKPLLVNKSID